MALLGLIPLVDRLASGARAVADVADPQPAAVRSPLAYAAFVSAELTRQEGRPRVMDSRTNPLLAAAFETAG